jgi:DNA-binding transcriptional LysR family regulator
MTLPDRSNSVAPSKLDLRSLIVFYYVASEESITAAAEKLFLTQPTITYHIRSLERDVGLKLLDIKKQKVALTRAGAGLFRYVGEIYQQMINAEKFLENFKEASLRIGISTTCCSGATPAACAFEKLFPGVRLVVRSCPSFEVAEEVLNYRVDLGIVVSADYANPKLKSIPISSREKLVLVASPSSSIARKQHLDFVNLCGYPLILGPETSVTRRIILNRIRNGGCHTPVPVIVEANSPEWSMHLVENGEGVGLYHHKTVEKAVAEGRLKLLPLSSEIWVGVEALVRADAPEHRLAERFISLAKEAFAAGREKRATER